MTTAPLTRTECLTTAGPSSVSTAAMNWPSLPPPFEPRRRRASRICGGPRRRHAFAQQLPPDLAVELIPSRLVQTFLDVSVDGLDRLFLGPESEQLPGLGAFSNPFADFEHCVHRGPPDACVVVVQEAANQV